LEFFFRGRYPGGSRTRVAGIEIQLRTTLPPWLPSSSWVKKYPGQPFIYCRSEVCSDRARAHLYLQPCLYSPHVHPSTSMPIGSDNPSHVLLAPLFVNPSTPFPTLCPSLWPSSRQLNYIFPTGRFKKWLKNISCKFQLNNLYVSLPFTLSYNQIHLCQRCFS